MQGCLANIVRDDINMKRTSRIFLKTCFWKQGKDKRYFSGDFSAFKPVTAGLIQYAHFPLWYMEKHNMPCRDPLQCGSQ